ncbi:MAG TPA: 30S ribosomal protein S20 [Bacteroidales bacterium]|nr:30S ribosomal protein S20 [Bacteroidales bacterium]
MANHISALKRNRANEKRRLHNRYYARTMRSALKKFRLLTDTQEAAEKLPRIVSLIDKLAKKRIIHKNKAANLKSKLTRKANSLLQ